jgi:glucuronate isomerase
MTTLATDVRPVSPITTPVLRDVREAASFLERCNPGHIIDVAAVDVFLHLKDLPIFDPHTHYSVPQIVGDVPWEKPTDIFLGRPSGVRQQNEPDFGFDHYIAQLMLMYNTPDDVVFGTKERTIDNEQERFSHLVRCMKLAFGSDRHLWFTTSLAQTFGLDIKLMRTNALQLWSLLQEKLDSGYYTPQSVLAHAGVEVALTTDDPASDLSLHAQSRTVRLIPTWRPDPVLMLKQEGRYDFVAWLRKVEQSAGGSKQVSDLDGLMTLLRTRMQYFKENRCVACDIGFPNFYPSSLDDTGADRLLKRYLGGEVLSDVEQNEWQGFMLQKLLELNAEFGFRQYLHQGPARDTNSEPFPRFGPDSGGDGQGENINRDGFKQLFNALFANDKLASTLLFPINAGDYDWVLNNKTPFTGRGEGHFPKIHLGPPWWWNDTREGIRNYIRSVLAADGPGAIFGMLSDARSLTSVHPRVLVYRAILAVELARMAKAWGCDTDTLNQFGERAAFTNQRDWLGLGG